jgi:hypothetical protein
VKEYLDKYLEKRVGFGLSNELNGVIKAPNPYAEELHVLHVNNLLVPT